MERITLSAVARTNYGKGSAREMRRQGTIPAVLYKHGKSDSITLDHKEITRFINSTRGNQVLINLKFADQSVRIALLKEYQKDPIKGTLLHADLIEIALDQKIRVMVGLNMVGEPIGVKRDKGIFQHVLRTVEIEAMPDHIPGHIDVDVTGLVAGHSLHISDVKAPEGVKILAEPTEVVAQVTIPVVEETKPAAGAAAATDVKQPEVAKKGKEEKAS